MTNTTKATTKTKVAQVTMVDGSVVNQEIVSLHTADAVLVLVCGDGEVIHLAPGTWVRVVETGKTPDEWAEVVAAAQARQTLLAPAVPNGSDSIPVSTPG